MLPKTWPNQQFWVLANGLQDAALELAVARDEKSLITADTPRIRTF
jgi:hypothetical protein